MATVKSTSSRSAVKSEKVAAHSHADLEAKVADLEARLKAALAALEARVSKCEKVEAPKAVGGKDEELREQLRVYFETNSNRKIPTKVPSL